MFVIQHIGKKIYIMAEQPPLIPTMSSDMEYSLDKDVISTNRFGASSSTSITLCNSRSWHGILSIYDQGYDRTKVLLSTLDDAVLLGGNTYYISVRKYPNVYFPMGYQYISAANFNPYPTIEYTLGNDAVLRKEMLLASDEPTLYVRYTLLSSDKPAQIRIRPIVAFRFIDELRHRDPQIFTGNTAVQNGIAYRPSDHEPMLYMQTSTACDFVTAPDWNYNIEYPIDHKAGRPYQEDLFMPGFFEINLVSSQEFIFSASLVPQQAEATVKKFASEIAKLKPRSSYDEIVQHAAQLMLRNDDMGCHVIETIPPVRRRSKDVCGAIAGLTLPSGNLNLFRDVADTYLEMYRNGLATGIGNVDYAPETPLWFVWSVQQYAYQQNDRYKIYREYGETIKKIINDIISSRFNRIFIDTEGLLSLKRGDRRIYYVEINAMWYNTLMFYAELCCSARFPEEAGKTSRLAHIVKNSLVRKFFDDKAGYFVNSLDSDGNKDTTFRVWQLPAFALPYAVVDNDKIAVALPMIEQKLLTPVGLRTMDPGDPKYATEGYVTPFYMGFLAEIYMRVLGSDGLKKAEELYKCFNNEINTTVPPNFYEKFAPMPPYEGIGAPMCAVSIATINRIRMLREQF